MTVNGQTICNIIQAFPALLILVQKTDKCLYTPLIYKPPTPTHPPEYYEAYDHLLHLLLHDSCHDFQYGVPHGYSKKYSYELGHKKLCYNFQYPNSVYGHFQSDIGHSYANNHSPHHGYDIYYPSNENHGYSYDAKNYIGSNGTYVYKTNHVPTGQVHRRKYKVVVKNVGRKRSQKLTVNGFYPQRGERALPSPFSIAQNFFPNTNGVRSTLNNLFNFGRHPQNEYGQNRPVNNNQFGPNEPFNNNQYPNRPIFNNQFGPNRPIYNNQYDPNRPIYNNQFGPNTPINNNQYDPNRPIYNNQFDPNRPNDNQFNQNRPNYPYNQENNVRFPNRGTEIIEVVEVPYEEVFGQTKPTNNPIQTEPTPEFVEQPNDVPKEENNEATNAPIENSMNVNNEPTSLPFDNEQGGQSEDPFVNKNGIPTAPPPQLTTTDLPRLTPVPPSESRNNFNFGPAGIFSNYF
ncbi:unnamed protein product [Euphydryas editha]|uniref:GATA zinc finger domain-containing protein 14-like n=1 Tax=Euphydryas editha TaxID=104508 RepID=A0AAU9U950_EUPED|nr:unnamed protein product [Euphydryas editha]